MKDRNNIEWDYTALADAYNKRPAYSEEALDALFRSIRLRQGDIICDIGAGTGHLTMPLLKRGYRVVAIEPNDAMRAYGEERTKKFSSVQWKKATGEDTLEPDSFFHMITFGSSFGVADRLHLLQETARIVMPSGWFACMWNHRDLEDPLQKEIEHIIISYIPAYAYGARREDQFPIIKKSGLFREVSFIEKLVIHTQSVYDCVEAWRSHATLYRQAGSAFDTIVDDIEKLLISQGSLKIEIPYMTRIWFAQVKK